MDLLYTSFHLSKSCIYPDIMPSVIYRFKGVDGYFKSPLMKSNVNYVNSIVRTRYKDFFIDGQLYYRVDRDLL